jgi:phosphate transport system substrate-binding protein
MVKMHDSSVVRLALFTTFVTVSAPWVSANAYPAFPASDALAKTANVRIQGSPNIEPLNQSLKQGFEKQYSGAKVSVTNSSTKAALDAVKSGKADMAAIGRPLSDAEKAQGLVAVPIGREKIAIVVGKNNPFNKDLTIPNFAKAFRGEIKDWSQIGGAKGGMQFVDRTDTDTRKAFPNYPAFQGKTFDSGSTGLKFANESPAKLGEKLGDRGISFLPASVAAEQPNLRILSMHGVMPTKASYPFSQPLYYVYKGDKPNDAVKAFLGYAGTNAGQAAVTGAGIAKAINFNNAAEAAAAAKDADTGAAAIAQAEKTVDKAGAKDAASKGAADGDKTTSMKTQTAAKEKAAGVTGDAAGKPDGTKAGGNVASNQIAIGDEVGGRIPSWLWWLLLPLGLLGLLLWLLPKDEDEEPIRPATGSRTVRGTVIGNPLQGAGDAIGGAVDAAGDAAGRTVGAVGDVAGRTVDAAGDAAKSGGAAVAGLGAAAAGLGAATFGKLKGNRTDNGESEWEPGSEPDEFKIETPDWNLEEGGDRSGNWLQNAKDRIGDTVAGARDAAGNVIDGTRDAAGNVIDQAGNLAGGAKDTAGDALNAGGATIAGAGAAAAGVGAAAWSALSGRKNEPGNPNIDLSLPTPESNWEFEGGELPEASPDASPRMADYADGSGANLFDRARDAASGAMNRARTGVGDVAEGASDLAGNAVGQVKSTTSKLGGAAEGSTGWLNKWLGKGKDAVEDATASAAGAADRVKDSIANTGAAAMAAGGAAVAGTGAAVGSVFSGSGRVVMVPYNSREALVRWELDARAQEQMRGQGGNQLVLRLYDVTDMDAISRDLPTFEQFDVDEAKQEQRILIPQRNRKYLSVLGYLTRAGGFMEVARSAEVQIPSA